MHFSGPINGFCFYLSIPRGPQMGPHKAKCIFPGPKNGFWIFFDYPHGHQIQGTRTAKFIFQGRKNAFGSSCVHPPKALKLRSATKQNAFFQAPKMHFAFSLSIPQGHQIMRPHKATCSFPGPESAFCSSIVHPSRPSNLRASQSQMRFQPPKTHGASISSVG